MTKKKEVLPSRSFEAAGSQAPELVQVSFTLTAVLKGDVCSKDGILENVYDTLSIAAEDTESEDVKVESFTLKLTEFKVLT